MKIVAFLQNQWFKDPVRAAKLRSLCVNPERWDYYMLFAGCVSGRRLRAAFGHLCNEIVWANASPLICGQADACPPADPVHMASVMNQHHPDVVLLFGNIAQDGFTASRAYRDEIKCVITGPHPACRGRRVLELTRMADQLRDRMHAQEVAS